MDMVFLLGLMGNAMKANTTRIKGMTSVPSPGQMGAFTKALSGKVSSMAMAPSRPLQGRSTKSSGNTDLKSNIP